MVGDVNECQATAPDPLERPQSVFALQKAIRDIAPRKRKLTFLDTIKKRLFSEMT